MEENFNKKITLDRNHWCKMNSTNLSKLKYNKIISNVLKAKVKKTKPSDYRLLKKYDLIEIDGITKLIHPISKNSTQKLFYVQDEELFDILLKVHLNLNHGGRDRMMKQLRQTYKNITYKDIQIFLSLCQRCQQKRDKSCRTDFYEHFNQSDGEINSNWKNNELDEATSSMDKQELEVKIKTELPEEIEEYEQSDLLSEQMICKEEQDMNEETELPPKDDDYYFLISLLPFLKAIPKEKKLTTRIEMLKLLNSQQ